MSNVGLSLFLHKKKTDCNRCLTWACFCKELLSIIPWLLLENKELRTPGKEQLTGWSNFFVSWIHASECIRLVFVANFDARNLSDCYII